MRKTEDFSSIIIAEAAARKMAEVKPEEARVILYLQKLSTLPGGLDDLQAHFERELGVDLPRFQEFVKNCCLAYLPFDEVLRFSTGFRGGWMARFHEEERREFPNFLDLMQKLIDQKARACEALAESGFAREALKAMNRLWAVNERLGQNGQAVLIQALPGSGKSAVLNAWAESKGGNARYLEVMANGGERGFIVQLARAVGTDICGSLNNNEYQSRIIEAVQKITRQMPFVLVIDEAHLLWPQTVKPQGFPHRIQFLKTLQDAGCSLVLAGTPKFSEYFRKCVEAGWEGAQFEERILRSYLHTNAPSFDDLQKIALALAPVESEETAIALAVDSAFLYKGGPRLLKNLINTALLCSPEGRITAEAMAEAIEELLPGKVELQACVKPKQKAPEGPRVVKSIAPVQEGKNDDQGEARDVAARATRPTREMPAQPGRTRAEGAELITT